MEKRAIIAIVLSILVLVLYQKFFLREPPRKREEKKAVERIEPLPPEPRVTKEPAEEKRDEGAGPKEGEKLVTREAPAEKGKRFRDVTVEAGLYSAIFSSYGGRL